MLTISFVILICVAVASGQNPIRRSCTDEIRPGVTVQDFCHRVQNRICVENVVLNDVLCECELHYKPENGTCTPQTCADPVLKSKVPWKDFCEFLGRRCTESPDSPPECECKTGFKEIDFGFCIAETCDEVQVGSTVTWRQWCELDHLKCIDSVFYGPTCVTSTCDDNKSGQQISWNEYCTRQNKNLVCDVRQFDDPHCICNFGYKNVTGTCRDATCSDTWKEDSPLTWNDLCDIEAPKQECFATKGKRPTCICTNKFQNKTVGNQADCVVKKCSDIRTGRKTWSAYCSGYNNKECREDSFFGPDCYCKPGYKEFNAGCKVQECSEKPENSEKPEDSEKTFDQICHERGYQICEKTDDRAPTCKCKFGFHMNTTLRTCIPSQCSDNRPGDKVTYESYCNPKKCSVSPLKGPICVTSTCNDTYSANLTYEKHCQNKTNMFCEEQEISVPKCKCKRGYQSTRDPFVCVVQTCSDFYEPGLTWNDFCAHVPNRHCIVVNGNVPQCVCKPGFSDQHTHQCEQIYCPKLKLSPNSAPEVNCTRIKADGTCDVSCAHGFEPQPSTHKCDISGKWEKDQASCAQIPETLCPELMAPGNGTVEGICRNARPTSVCTFNCNPGYEMWQVGGISKYLTCTTNGKWSLPEPVCVDKCQQATNILMCEQDNAVCFNEHQHNDLNCMCNSPYLIWKRGKGCQYQKNGYIMTIGGLKFRNKQQVLLADSGTSILEQEQSFSYLELIIGFLEIFRTVLDLETVRIVHYSRQLDMKYFYLDLLIFSKRPISTELLEVLARDEDCSEYENGDCVISEDLTIRPEDLKKVTVKEAKPACDSSFAICPDGSRCIQNKENPMAYTCKCEEKFSTVHEQIYEDPNSFRPVVCEYKNTASEFVVTKLNNSVVVVGAVLGVLLFLALCGVAALAYKLKAKSRVV